jgi:succinate dehydrogenase flavin-adding protein (antitoxin of CptAB toxin-antitoxin module)
MGYRSTRVEVDVDLDDFYESDLVNYLEEKGYTVMEGKNKSKFETFEQLDKRIWQLYLLYKSDKGAGHEMDKALGTFFGEYYNKVST